MIGKYIRITPAGEPILKYHGLTPRLCLKTFRLALREIGLTPRLYGLHSLRRSSARIAAQNGMPEARLKLLGQWKSTAYMCYVAPTPDEAAHHLARILG
jgi:hypothetical protein